MKKPNKFKEFLKLRQTRAALSLIVGSLAGWACQLAGPLKGVCHVCGRVAQIFLGV